MLGLNRRSKLSKKARRRAKDRFLTNEQLEARLLLTSDWHNACNAFDVSNDGYVTPLDALMPINRINQQGAGELPSIQPPNSPDFDTSGNGSLEPLDALLVINVLNGFHPAPLFSFEGGLANDTGWDPAQRADGLTSDALLSGQMNSIYGLSSLSASIDGNSPIAVHHGGCGAFTIDPGFETDGSDDGPHVVELVGKDRQGNSESFEITFSLDTQAPLLSFDLSASSDSGIPGDGSTTRNQVELVGQTEPASVVDYAGQNINADAIGNFAIPNIDLVAGSNVLSVTAYDQVGNTTTVQQHITHTACDFDDDFTTGTDVAGNMPWNGGYYNPIQPENASLPLTSADGESVQFATAIINQDFFADLVSLSMSSNEVLVQLGTGSNFFQPATSYDSGGVGPQSVAIADVIGNRLPDILVGHADGTLAFLEAVGDGQFVARPDLTRLGLGNIVDLTTFDFDGDRDTDIVVSGTYQVTLLANDNDEFSSNPITNGDFVRGTAGWQPAVHGTSPGGIPGTINVGNGYVQLVENDSFLVSINQTFVVPRSPESVTFDILDLSLDSGLSGVPDAFEVSLLNESNESLVPTIANFATSFFNANPNGIVEAAAGVTLDGHTVTLDISALSPGSQANLYFDLIGNQPETGSTASFGNVRVAPGANYVESLTATPLPGPFGSTAGVGTCDANHDGHLDIVVEDASNSSFIAFEGDGQGNFIRRDNNGGGEGESTNRAILIGEVVNDTLATSTEVDAFTFEAHDGQNLFFDAQDSTGLQLWSLTDPNGMQIFTGGFADHDVVPISLSGTYTLTVTGFLAADGPYQFQIHEVPDPTTTTIQIGDPVASRLNVPGERLIFTFEGGVGQRLFFDSLLSLGASTWRLTDPSSNTIFETAFADTEGIELTVAGLYTLEIDGQGDTVGEYQFQINDVSADAPAPIDFDQEVLGSIDVSGQTRLFTFTGLEGAEIFLDKFLGDDASLTFELRDDGGQVLLASRLEDSGPFELPNSGKFVLAVDAVGDALGDFGLVLWNVPTDVPRTISLGENVPGSITVPGQTARFVFDANAGQEITFDEIFGPSGQLEYSVFSPSGATIFAGVTDDYQLPLLPETGSYTLVVDAQGDEVGDFSFRVVEGIVLPPINAAADLVVENLEAPRRVVGDQSQITLSWDIVNNGSVAVPAGTTITNAVYFSGDQDLDGFDSDPRIQEFELTLAADLLPTEATSQTANLPLTAGMNADFQVILKTDSKNRVFENQLENNNIGSSRIAIYESRNLIGGPQLEFDFVDGQEVTAGVPITISGTTTVPSGAVNAIFMLDVSGSTRQITGLDANFDGLVNSDDDLNLDGNVGDLLDKEIGLVIETVSRLEEQIDDLRVAVVAWGMSHPAFPDAGEPVDLGSARFNQTFFQPGKDSLADADFETALKSVRIHEQGLITFAGATHFRPFVIGSGNNYDEGLQEVLNILEVAPDADANQVYFFTDGLFYPNEDIAAEESTIAAVGELGIQFRAAQVAGPELVAQLCASGTPPAWCSVVQTGENFVEEVLRISDGIDATPLSTGSIVLADTQDSLDSVAFTSTRIAGVTINGQAVDSLDPAGSFFSVQSFTPGDNLITAQTIDSTGTSSEQQLTLIGVPNSPPDLEQFRDASTLGDVSFSGTTFNRQYRTLHVDAAIENLSFESLAGPVVTTFHSQESPSVVLANAAGTTADGARFAQFRDEIPISGLQPAMTSEPTRLEFSNPNLARFSFDVGLLALNNHAPLFNSIPTVLAEVGSEYLYDLSAEDQDGNSLEFQLVGGPEGMTLDVFNRNLSWTPSPTQLGNHAVQIEVRDGFGGTARQSFQIVVHEEIPNRPPLFQSVPPVQVAVGEVFEYQPEVLDLDGDLLSLSLDVGPVSMQLDASTNTLRWNVPASGDHNIEISATDNYGNSATQAFVLTVGDSATNAGAPEILSTPASAAAVGVAYFYLPLAQDPDGDELSYSLAVAPEGANVDEKTGQIDWTPNSSQVGAQFFLLRADDGRGAFATQFYSVDVLEQVKNLPPVFQSLPGRLSSVGEHYTYNPRASDPDRDPLTYTLVQGPADSAVNSTTGQVSFTPQESQIGVHRFILEVRDERGEKGVQSYDLEVRPSPNAAPVFTSTPSVETVVDKAYFYRPQATDEHDQVSFDLITAPIGMSIDSGTGLIEFYPTATQLGEHAVVVRATDERGAITEQSYELQVTNDTTAPVVSILLSQDVVNPGTAVEVQVIAADDVGVNEIRLTLDDMEIPLDVLGKATVTLPDPGLFSLRATAVDSSGNVGIQDSTLRVIDPADTTPPEIDFLSPLPGESISYLTEIVGSVNASDLEFYRVDFAETGLLDLDNLAAASSVWTTLAESTQPANESTLTQFDPTVLSNGDYILRIYAQDFSGNANIQAVPVTVDGPAKLGQFSLDFVDLSIPLAGLPIEITRQYSTLNADVSGDFGFGWSLGLAEADIRETVSPASEDQIGIFGQTAFVYGTRVYITNPDGQRIGFTFEPERTGSLFGEAYAPKFTPDPGVSDQLVVDPVTLSQREDGSFVAFLFGFSYNPSEYQLVRRDGTVYQYDETSGLRNVTDRHGNQLVFHDDGMTHSSGESIDFFRDELGRITQIMDPAGGSLTYQYTASGNLAAVTDQVGVTTRFTYLDEPANYLTDIVGPNGHLVQRTEYDATGRIVATIDAQGNRFEQLWDPSNFAGTTIDGNGNVTELVYNERGNVLIERDPLGHETLYEYNDSRHPDLETTITDRRGFVIHREYDERGNILKIIEAGHQDSPFDEPVITSFTYNEANQETSRTDGLNNTLVRGYDALGNLVEVIDAQNNRATLTYDAQGRLQTATDFNGHTKTFEYASGELPTKVALEDGAHLKMAYNHFGRVTLIEFFESDGTLSERHETEYDEVGRIIAEIKGSTDPSNDASTTTKRFYQGQQLDYQVVVNPESLDADGNLLESNATPVGQRKSSIVDFQYDLVGRLIQQTDANGGATEIRYDGNGNVILLRDPAGNITTWVYDALNRISEKRDPFYNVGLTIEEALDALDQESGADCSSHAAAPHVTLHCYDQEGNRTRSIDRNGRRIDFAYDYAGRLTEEVWYGQSQDLLRTITFSYDVIGNLVTTSDPDSSYTFRYDTLNRVTSIDNDGSPGVPHVVLNYEYDKLGNVVRTQDDRGVQVESEYDSRDQLSVRKWSGPGISPARVDFEYNAVSRGTEISRFSDLDANQLIARTSSTKDLLGRPDRLTHVNNVDQILAEYDFDYDFYGLLADEQLDHQDAQFDQTVNYAYDLNGQIIHSIGTNADDESYAYDANGNRISDGNVVGTNNQITSNEEFAYAYDGEGNLVAKTEIASGKVTEYSYDHRNRLVFVRDRTSTGVVLSESEYVYDSLGRRIAVIGNGHSTYTIHDTNNIWADYNADGEVQTGYLFGNRTDHLLARHRPSEGTSWYLAGKQGSVRDIVDAGGQLVAHIDYDAFGAIQNHSNLAIGDRFAFTGREVDNAVGLYYYRARHYDPQLGRFLSQDPLGFAANDTNLYRYVNNSPTNLTDPTGLKSAIEYSLIINLVAATAAFYCGGFNPGTALLAGSGGVAATTTLGVPQVPVIAATLSCFPILTTPAPIPPIQWPTPPSIPPWLKTPPPWLTTPPTITLPQHLPPPLGPQMAPGTGPNGQPTYPNYWPTVQWP